MEKEIHASGISDFAEAVLRTALEAGRSKDLERQIEPLLKNWESHPCCSFATAFRFRASDSGIDAYNPLPPPSTAAREYVAFLELINPDRSHLPRGATLPWKIFRDAANAKSIEIFPPHVLVEGDKDDSPWNAAKRHEIVFLNQITDEELQSFIEQPTAHAGRLLSDGGVDAIQCSLRCFALAPARIADRLRPCADKSSIKKTCALVYIMGTRRHFANVGSAFDYGLVVGLTEDVLRSQSTPDTTIESIWCAWNLMAVPVYLQDREARFSSLEAGRDVVHTIKTDLGRNVDPALDDICLKCEDGTFSKSPEEARRAVERIRVDLYSYPYFSSFVARRPCAANTEDGLRAEDVERHTYVPSVFLNDWLSQQLKERRSAVDSGFREVELMNEDTKKAPRMYVNQRYLAMALAEAVDNMRRSGDQSKACSIRITTDDALLHLKLTNQLKAGATQGEGPRAPKVKQGHGLNALRAFCQAMGGDIRDPIVDKESFTLAISIGLKTFDVAYGRLNNVRGP